MKIANPIFAAFVLLFVAHSAQALDPRQPANSYIRTHFTGDNEAPSGVVHYIVQSRDGFLWIMSGPNQLTRFDGQRFTTLPVGRAGAMALGPDGDLWVVTGVDLAQIPAAALNQF